ncbi:MAG: TetR/AcrR family transcriptional regulator [Anaerolineales bacterium]|nr:TetR/AcrR family transcriptional regulator [Anaerolineales bacterium]
MSDPTPTKGEQTRTDITAAAHDLFITQGYHGTSMRQIAQQAGIALGGIYNHFNSKEDIFEAVFIENHPFLEMLPAIEAAQGETVEALVRDAADLMVATMRRRTDFLNLMFIEIVEFKSVHANQLFQHMFPRGLGIVQRFATVEGQLRPIPAPMLVRAFIGLFFSYQLAEIIFGTSAPPDFSENAMQHYVDIFLHGILEE